MRNDANYLNKYLDVTREWKNHVIELKVMLATNNRLYSALAKDQKFRSIPKISELILSTSQLNDRVHQLLDWTKDFLEDVEKDAKAVFDGAELRNKLKDQSDTIIQLMNHRDKLETQLIDEIRRNKKTT